VTLRIVATVALLLGVALVLAYLEGLDKGPFASAQGRHQRAMKDRTAEPATYQSATFASLADLPRNLPVAEYATLERRAVTLECYVRRMFRARDGDYHLDLAPEPGDANTPERHYAVAEITPQYHRGTAWRFERLAARFRPLHGAGTWDGPPRRVRLSGLLMYDHEHGAPPPGEPWPALLSQWEIHPVTRIEAWDDSLAAFVEVPR